MKIWVDDSRPAPEGYFWCKSVDEAIFRISHCMRFYIPIELIDLDHDAGDYADKGGDYINILNWMEEYSNPNYRLDRIPIRIHSMNAVGVENMRRINQKNGWKAVFV